MIFFWGEGGRGEGGGRGYIELVSGNLIHSLNISTLNGSPNGHVYCRILNY